MKKLLFKELPEDIQKAITENEIEEKMQEDYYDRVKTEVEFALADEPPMTLKDWEDGFMPL